MGEVQLRIIQCELKNNFISGLSLNGWAKGGADQKVGKKKYQVVLRHDLVAENNQFGMQCRQLRDVRVLLEGQTEVRANLQASVFLDSQLTLDCVRVSKDKDSKALVLGDLDVLSF